MALHEVIRNLFAYQSNQLSVHQYQSMNSGTNLTVGTSLKLIALKVEPTHRVKAFNKR